MQPDEGVLASTLTCMETSTTGRKSGSGSFKSKRSREMLQFISKARHQYEAVGVGEESNQAVPSVIIALLGALTYVLGLHPHASRQRHLIADPRWPWLSQKLLVFALRKYLTTWLKKIMKYFCVEMGTSDQRWGEDCLWYTSSAYSAAICVDLLVAAETRISLRRSSRSHRSKQFHEPPIISGA